MKPTPIFVAAAGFAMLGACSVKTEDNNVESVDANAAVTTGSAPTPVAADNAGVDTLGNQLNQLNESDAATSNEAESGGTNSAD